MADKSKVRVATIWLSGCSGCHMSFLDQDEALIDMANQIQLVYSPIVDVKVFPENVDVTLVEGAVANEDQQELLKFARERTKILISMGDCAVTGNVTGLRNAFNDNVAAVLNRAYIETADVQPQIPTEVPDTFTKSSSSSRSGQNRLLHSRLSPFCRSHKLRHFPITPWITS